MVNEKTMMLAAFGAGAAILLWIASRGVSTTAQDIGRGAVDAIDGVFVGSIEGIAQVFDIPTTSTSQCEADKAAGRTWEASFSCPAKDFLSYLIS